MSPHRGKKFPIETLTAAEVIKLINACSTRSTAGQRNRTIIITLYRSGLRMYEMLNLQPKDVDLDGGTVTVLHGKGDKARTVGIDTTTCLVLSDWMKTRASIADVKSPLFCTTKGQRLAAQNTRRMITRIGKLAGIQKLVHAHGLRHTHASELVAEGVPLNEISKQLGHSSSAVTSRYVDHVNPIVRINRMRDREWSV